MVKNKLIKIDGTTAALPDGELSLAQMYEAIGCSMVELVRLDDNQDLWCDEEGLLKGEPVINSTATELYRSAIRSSWLKDGASAVEAEKAARSVGIVGNVILTTHQN